MSSSDSPLSDKTEALRERSGRVNGNRLESFIYELLRDHIPSGQMEVVTRNSESKVVYRMTNGWLARYAKDVARRLTK